MATGSTHWDIPHEWASRSQENPMFLSIACNRKLSKKPKLAKLSDISSCEPEEIAFKLLQ
ncbi:hypothetical protein SCA6_014553 [Theobroma cacao]